MPTPRAPLEIDADRPRRILIVRLSHLGDVVHALPLYHALRAEHPEARIAWAVQDEFAGLVRGLEGLDRVVSFDRRGGLGAWPRLREELAQFGADHAIDAQGNLKSALVTLCSGAARRSGWSAADWTERFGAHVLTDPAPPLEKHARHAVERVLQLARHVAPRGAQLIPSQWWEPEARELARARRRLNAWMEGAGGAPLTIVLLSTPGDVRSWPAGHYAALGRELSAAGARALFISGPAEEELGRELEVQLADAPRIAHWVGQRGLSELAALFCAAAEAGARALACDSGPMHLAAACGLPVIALAGPQDALRTGPWPPLGGAHRSLTAVPSPPCAPCLARRCTHADGPVCMTRLSPDTITRVLLERELEIDVA